MIIIEITFYGEIFRYTTSLDNEVYKQLLTVVIYKRLWLVQIKTIK